VVGGSNVTARAVSDRLVRRLGVARGPDAEHSASDLLARGAVRAAQRRNLPVVRQGRFAADAKRTIGFPRPVWTAAAAVLLLALGLWAWSDLRAADAVRASDAEADAIAKQATVLRRQLDLLDYLQKRPPTLLAMLDEFTDKSPHFNPNTLRYDADAGLEITGILRSSGDINALVSDLAGMRTLASAQLRNQKNEGRDKVAYDIAAVPSPRFFEAFVPPPRQAEAESNPEAESDTDSDADAVAETQENVAEGAPS
jgi:hypothetical protein